MITTKMNRNGQVSIPAQLRKKFWISINQELEIVETNEWILYKKPLISSWQDLENLIPVQKEYSDEILQWAKNNAYKPTVL